MGSCQAVFLSLSHTTSLNAEEAAVLPSPAGHGPQNLADTCLFPTGKGSSHTEQQQAA